MDNSFFAYLQLLELMAFFSGYALIYSLAMFISGKIPAGKNYVNISRALPYAYALVGTLYLGLQLRNLYPDYSIQNLRNAFLQPYLIIWALLSLLFWIPAIGKRPVLSLLHSLVFFFFLLKDIFLQMTDRGVDKNILSNDMTIYTTSLLVNISALVFIVLVTFLYRYFMKRSKPGI